jgi:DNA primase
MPFVDFSAVKAAISIEQAAQFLGLQLKQAGLQFRSPCPSCKDGGDRALVITPAKGLFYCFADRKGGDVIALAAHIRQCETKEAASILAEQFGLGTDTGTKSAPVPQKTKPGDNPAFKGLDYLQHDHDAVEAVGFDAETAKALGIGFAPRGMMAGLVAVPVRLEDGTLAGYIGITEAKLPKTFHLVPTNVVSFPKRTA